MRNLTVAFALSLLALSSPAHAKPTTYQIGLAYWRRESKTDDPRSNMTPPWRTISGAAMSCFKQLPNVGAEVTLVPLGDPKLPTTRRKIVRAQPETDPHERNECPHDVAVEPPASPQRLLTATPLAAATVDFLFIAPPVATATVLAKSGRPQPKQLDPADAGSAHYVDIDGDGRADFCVGSSGETSQVYLQWIAGAWRVLNEVDGD